MNTEALAKLKMLLGIKDNEQDDLLSFIIEDTENLVNGYCHTDTVPVKLESLIPVMAADMYRRKGYGQEEAPQKVKSISEGDRSISFGEFSTSEFLSEYESRLKPFRCRRGRLPSEL